MKQLLTFCSSILFSSRLGTLLEWSRNGGSWARENRLWPATFTAPLKLTNIIALLARSLIDLYLVLLIRSNLPYVTLRYVTLRYVTKQLMFRATGLSEQVQVKTVPDKSNTSRQRDHSYFKFLGCESMQGPPEGRRSPAPGVALKECRWSLNLRDHRHSLSATGDIRKFEWSPCLSVLDLLELVLTCTGSDTCLLPRKASMVFR